MNAFLVGSAVVAMVGPPVAPRFEAFHKGAADNTPTPSAGYALTHRASAVDPAAGRAPDLRFPFTVAVEPGRLNPLFPECRLLSFDGAGRNPLDGVRHGLPPSRRVRDRDTPDVIGASADYPALQLAARLAPPAARRDDPAPTPDTTAEMLRVVRERAKLLDSFRDDALDRLIREAEVREPWVPLDFRRRPGEVRLK